jgi:plasmid stabilization system protein ParE
MNFIVLWTEFAESNLARMWLDAHNRDALSRAADEIDRALAQRPQELASRARKGTEFTLNGRWA